MFRPSLPGKGTFMPWTSTDARKHTRAATSSRLRRLWADVANATLARTGSDREAIREANAAVDKARAPKRKARWL